MEIQKCLSAVFKEVLVTLVVLSPPTAQFAQPLHVLCIMYTLFQSFISPHIVWDRRRWCPQSPFYYFVPGAVSAPGLWSLSLRLCKIHRHTGILIWMKYEASCLPTHQTTQVILRAIAHILQLAALIMCCYCCVFLQLWVVPVSFGENCPLSPDITLRLKHFLKSSDAVFSIHIV